MSGTASTSTGQDGTGSLSFDPGNVNLTLAASDSTLATQITCFLQLGQNEYDGDLGSSYPSSMHSTSSHRYRPIAVADFLGTRISALFVILVVSSCATFFPVLAARVRWLRIPLYVYLFARYFGAGVIIATAFIQ